MDNGLIAFFFFGLAAAMQLVGLVATIACCLMKWRGR